MANQTAAEKQTATANKAVTAAVEFAQTNQARFVDELKPLLRIPSVSTAPEHRGDVRRAAEFCAADLTRIGMDHVHLIETSTPDRPRGQPLVYADHLHAP